MTVAPFVLADWQAQFPAFSTLTSIQGQTAFNIATLYVGNDDCSRVPCDATTYEPRQLILYLAAANAAAQLYGVNGQAPSGLVGPITSASEGSVSVGTGNLGLSAAAAWFASTPWGIAAWQALAPYRTAVYRASPGRFAQGPYGAYGGPFGYGYGGAGSWPRQ